ncbi:MAG: hypothetical protein IKA82_02140 [Clostridia bacterium]|nr:hypothetical protein [Clostridia bacterium]
MPQNAIVIILNTEKKAAQMIADAKACAEELVSSANKAGETSLSEFEAKRRADGERTVQEIRQSAAELESRSETEAMSRAAELKSAAEPRMHLAIKEIIKGIMESCR